MRNKKISNRRHTIRVPKVFFLYLFLVIWHFEPTYFSTLRIIDSMFSIGKITSFIVVTIMLAIRRKISNTKMLTSIGIYSSVLLLSTIINEGNIVNAVTTVASMITLYLIVCEMLNSHPGTAVSVFMLVFECLIYSNLIIMFLYPRGVYNIRANGKRFYWLLGQQNANILYVMCAFCVAIMFYILHKNDRGKYRSFLLSAMGILTILKSGSANGYIGLFLFFVLLIVNRNKVRITVFHGLLFSFVIFLTIVIFRKQYLFENIISTLNRDLTFSGRLNIWDAGIRCFLEKPLLGFGVEYLAVAKMRFCGFETSHNKLLYILYQGGIALAVPFIGIIVSAGRNLATQQRTIATVILSSAIVTVMTLMQAESYATAVFYFIFFLTDGMQKLASYCNYKTK